jgi:hypothetical protein
MQARNIFKKVPLKDKEFCLIYPSPVIKESKYLIQVEDQFAAFFVNALKESFLPSPDINKEYIYEHGTHSDGNTTIFHIRKEILQFNLLVNHKLDSEKAKVINNLLNNKIISVLKLGENAKKELSYRFKKQKECSTCQKLGILNPKLEDLINTLLES